MQRADVYSFSIIVQEIFLEDSPYAANEPKLEPDEILHNVMRGSVPPFRPKIPDGACTQGWIDLIQECWYEDPEKSPNFSQILLTINTIHRHKAMDLVDNMVRRLEKHTRHLEERVTHRSRELQEEKHKVETLLRELLPASVATSLAAGKTVEPEAFEDSTLFFSDIVGFTRVSAIASPIQIGVMLNSMYTLFDDLTHNYDVYKVATIGDAYVVASGVPIRNGDKHGSEICQLSLHLLEAIGEVEIPHMPEEKLKMRIGIHSGPCVGGVIGIKMARYLLFGETVDMTKCMVTIVCEI